MDEVVAGGGGDAQQRWLWAYVSAAVLLEWCPCMPFRRGGGYVSV